MKSIGVRYLINVKPGNHKWLFSWVNASQCAEFTLKDKHNEYEFNFINQVPLNESNEAFKINFLECRQVNAKKEEKLFTSITNFHIIQKNTYQLTRTARTRLRIENETFNTPKNNQGYNFEHNYGHGKKHLSNVVVYLMMPAFLRDQLQQMLIIYS